MIDTRRRLQQLLDRDNISANLFAEICKVPAPTIYRFLNGDIGEPRTATICKWAEALKVTEAQMRGIDPVEGLDDIREVVRPVTLESVLTPDELAAIEGMRGQNKNLRHAWLLIGKELCAVGRKKAPERPPIGTRASGLSGMQYRNQKKGLLPNEKKA